MALIPSYDYSLFSTDAASPLDSWDLGGYNEFLSSDPVSAVNNALSSIASVAQPMSYTYSPTAGAITPFAAPSIPSAVQGFAQPNSGSNITIYATGGDAQNSSQAPSNAEKPRCTAQSSLLDRLFGRCCRESQVYDSSGRCLNASDGGDSRGHGDWGDSTNWRDWGILGGGSSTPTYVWIVLGILILLILIAMFKK